jgi:hypothetical protein
MKVRYSLRQTTIAYYICRPLSAPETEPRLYLLFATLDNCDRVVQDAGKLCFEMQEFFPLLIARRSPTNSEELPARSRWEPPAENFREFAGA